MQIINTGTIKANKKFEDKQMKIIESVLDEVGGDIEIYFNEINFNDYYDAELSCALKDLCILLSKDGYVLNGCVEYYGDFDGKIFIKNNSVKEYDIRDIWKYDATDEEIIKVLESRGYIITLKGKPAW